MTNFQRSWTPTGQPADVPPPAGAYCRAVRAGDFLFVSGQVPREFESGAPLGSDFAGQTRAVMENLRRVLDASDARLEDVVSLTVYLQDTADWNAFDEVYRQHFDPPYPTRTVVGADLRGILVEISAVAYVGGSTRSEGSRS